MSTIPKTATSSTNQSNDLRARRTRKWLQDALIGLMKELDANKREPAIDPRLQELVVGFVAGGAYMLLTQWISNKTPYSAEQMGLLFSDLTAPCENVKLAR